MAELPTDDLLLTEDEEFDAAFFDPDAEYDEEPEIEVAPRAYGRTWQFDLATGRIMKYGDRPVEISGLDNLRQRLDRIYAGDFLLAIDEEDGQVCVRIDLPAGMPEREQADSAI